MNKKFVGLIKTNYKFFRFFVGLYNHINVKNKLIAKGCKVSIGVSQIKGLKIINFGTDNEITVGNFANIKNSSIVIYGSHNKITIKDYARLNKTELHMEDDNNEIVIGEHTVLSGNSQLATIEGTKIIIGNNCLFSSDLYFATGDSHSILNMQGDRINPSENIVIEDHVWVGTKVTCLKGVYVSKDSIVAANTTLCKKYETGNVIIAGVPGKIVKTEVNWSSQRI